MNNSLNIESLRVRLEQERAELLKQLSSIAQQDPHNPDNWQAIPPKEGGDDFRDEVADRLEEQDAREGLTTPLETRLREVNEALARITNGTYGVCEIGGEEISRERLEANPAARTCRRHMENDAGEDNARPR